MTDLDALLPDPRDSVHREIDKCGTVVEIVGVNQDPVGCSICYDAPCDGSFVTIHPDFADLDSFSWNRFDTTEAVEVGEPLPWDTSGRIIVIMPDDLYRRTRHESRHGDLTIPAVATAPWVLTDFVSTKTNSQELIKLHWGPLYLAREAENALGVKELVNVHAICALRPGLR